MKKSIVIALIALMIQPVVGQKLVNQVPENAQYVLTINNPTILKKMSIAEMEELPFMKEMVKQFIKERKYYGTYNSADERLGMNDLGFDLTKKSYVFMEPTDSVMYFCYLVPLNNASKFEALNDTSMLQIYYKKGLKIIGKGTSMVAWNKKTALFMVGQKDKNYFKNNSDIYSRYGIEEDNQDEEHKYYSKYNDQKKIVAIWMKAKAKDIFDKKNKKKSTPAFIKYEDETAACSMWSSPTNFYSHYVGLYSGMKIPKLATPGKFPGGEMSSHLYFNKNNISIKTAVSLNETSKKSYDNIFNNQLNPKFFNYIDKDKFLSYFSNAFSVTGSLQETPNLINNYFGETFNKYGVSETVDLISVIIDEEAIGKVVVGDAIFVLTDISSVKKEYTAYEWDEEYINKTEVTKMKEEIIPTFLYMVSTKDEASVEKIFKLAMKGTKRLVKKEGYYELDMYKNAPFKMYFIVRDGIIFMCNSEQQLQDILTNKKVNSLDKSFIESLSATSLQIFIDAKKIMNKFPEPDGTSARKVREREMFIYAKENIGPILVKQNLPTDSGLTSEITYSFTSKEKNGLSYFLNFLNDLYVISEKK